MSHDARRSGALLLASATVVLAAILGACGSGDRGASSRPTRGAPHGTPSGVVDSALPIAKLLERFRRDTPETLTVLTGGADSPELLSRTLLTALAARDSAAVRTLVLSRAEFAWLYYPHSQFVTRPYELGPELVWLTHAAASEKGARRLLNRFGGRPLRFVSLSCPAPAEPEGPNSIISGCAMRFADGDGAPRTLRLFGALLNRNGRYKFLSYANDL